MGAGSGWFTTIVLLVGTVLVFQHLGINLAPMISSMVHGVEHFLGQPLAVG